MTLDANGRLQVVFRRIHPLLQTLLPLVTKFQEVVESGESQEGYSSLIELTKPQIQLLENFEEVLVQLGTHDGPSLVVLADYISLPLNAILHISATFVRNSKAEIDSQDRILASHIRRLDQSAAHTIQVFVQASCSNPVPGSVSSVRLNDAQIIAFVASVASVLPASTTLFDGKALDDGLELCMTLLGTIKTLIQVCSGTSLYDKWEGDLVVKIVDFGTSIDVYQNDHLHLLSLEILDGLLTKVKRSDLWQRIFPGIFTHVYRRLMASGRKTSGVLSMQIEAKSVKAIDELIKVSIAPFVEQRSMNTETNFLLLQSMTSSYNSERAGQSDSEEKFLDDLKSRVSGPLGHLMRQCSLSSSESVQLQVISLCETILIESRACWRSTSLLGNTMDICLTLQLQDSRESLATSLTPIISTFQGSQFAQESWMIPRIQSLAGGTLSIARNGGNQAEIRMQLQLLMGYMRYTGNHMSASLAASSGIRDSLLELGCVDLESCSPQNVKRIGNGQESATILFRHLSAEAGGLFRKVLRQYGSSIGWKHGSRLIDMLVSDFCERSFEHLKNSSGSFQVHFFHQNIGALVICEEVIRGAYASGQTVKKKEQRRKRDSLQALASSCLPLFLDSLLWNVSTIEGSMEHSDRGAAPRSFQGNACVISLVLKVVAAFFDVMGRNSGILLHAILCPIIEKASQRNNDLVRAIAKEAGLSLAVALEFSAFSDLVQQNMSTVLVGLLARLRSVPCGTAPNETLLLDAMKGVQWVLLHTKASREGIRGFADFLSFIETQLDHLSMVRPLSSLTLKGMVALHRAYLENTCFFFDSGVAHHGNTTLMRNSVSFVNALSPYENFSSRVILESSVVSEELPLRHDSEIYMVGLNIISRIISRENTMLAKPNLELQVSACRAMLSAFRALEVFPKNSGSQADHSALENAILKQAAKSWPSIRARFHSIATDVLQSRVVKVSFIACQASHAPQAELATSEYFLAELLELITVLCECCGDFMASRFSKNVWPTIAHYLGSIIQNGSQHRVILPEDVKSNIKNPHPDTDVCDSSDSERQLILSTLDCVGRVSGILDLQENVQSAVACVLVPFLGTPHFGANVEDRAMLALKRLANANYDVLWRPLLQLLRPSLSPFPNNQVEFADKTMVDERLLTDRTVLPQKAAELLSYIKCLPEQPTY